MRSPEIRHEVINKRKLDLPQVLVVGAHTDDDAMFNLTTQINKKGYGVSIATLTNSNNRQLPGIEPDELAEMRWQEAISSGRRAGITQVARLESVQDGNLFEGYEEGIILLSEMLLSNEVIAIGTPHEEDAHPDHQEAAALGKAVAGKRTALYRFDTISGRGFDNRLLIPGDNDFYVPLSDKTAHREKMIYMANTSQVTNLPPDQMQDVQMVNDMTARRGREIGRRHAAIVFDARNAQSSPLREMLLAA